MWVMLGLDGPMFYNYMILPYPIFYDYNDIINDGLMVYS